jgi:hypothetical protein
LDSFQAERLVEALAALAKENGPSSPSSCSSSSSSSSSTSSGQHTHKHDPKFPGRLETEAVAASLFATDEKENKEAEEAEEVEQEKHREGLGGKTIACVIHQPSAAVFSLFDDLLLLSETGRCLYSGSVDGLKQHFKAAGYPVPKGSTVAEWALRLASIDAETSDTKKESLLRIDALVAAHDENWAASHQDAAARSTSSSDSTLARPFGFTLFPFTSSAAGVVDSNSSISDSSMSTGSDISIATSGSRSIESSRSVACSKSDDDIEWSSSGTLAARKAPFFVRGLVRRKTEAFARSKGFAVIDESVVLAAKQNHEEQGNSGGGSGGGGALSGSEHSDSAVTVPAPSSGIVVEKKRKEQLVKTHSRNRRRNKTEYPASMREQYALLLSRAWREVARGKLPIFIKVAQQVSTALIFASIFKLDDDAAPTGADDDTASSRDSDSGKSQQPQQLGIQTRFGLLSLVCTGAANIGVASTIRAFPKEKAIVAADRAKRIYPVAPYFLSKLVAEVPLSVFLSSLGGCLLYPLVGFQRTLPKFFRFLGVTALQSFTASALGMLIGAAAPTSDAALALFPPLVVLMVIFNGFNINDKATPAALKLLPKLSLIRWGFEGLAINEFTGLKFPPPPTPPSMNIASASSSAHRPGKGLRSSSSGRGGPLPASFVSTGEEALLRVGLDVNNGATLEHAVKSQATLLAGCYAGTYAILRRQKPRFVKMAPALKQIKRGPRYSPSF